jgi:hypothetical protein
MSVNRAARLRVHNTYRRTSRRYAVRSAEQRHAEHAAKVAARKEQQAQRLAGIQARQAERTAAHADRKAIMEQAKAAQAENAPAARFPALGVQIMANGDLHTFNGIGGRGRLLGPAAGAVAEVGDERRRHRVSGAVSATVLTGSPLAMIGAAGKKAKASAFVTLADGTFHERKLDGNAEVSRAHRETAAFRAAIIRLD